MIRLVSWNVNGVRACWTNGMETWFSALPADVFCMQEVRASLDQAPPELLDGWHVAWADAEQKGYSGVATLSRRAPDSVEIGLGDPQFDAEGRTVTTRYGDLTVINCYFPNGQRDLSRVPYKLDYTKRMLEYGEACRRNGERVTICGDWNTAHHPVDLRNWKSNQKTTGFLPHERAALDEFQAAGWHDAFRRLHPEAEHHYSWWSTRSGARARNVGWRIDYHWVCDKLMADVVDARIHPWVLGSDHCPVELVLAR